MRLYCTLITGKVRPMVRTAPQAVASDVIDGSKVMPTLATPLQTEETFAPSNIPGPGSPQEPSAPKFTLPLRDLTTNDGDQAVFRVFYQGWIYFLRVFS